MVFTSMCLRITSGEVSRTGLGFSSIPALEIKTSRCMIPCLVVSSVTAAAGSVSIVESILTIISLLFLPVGTDNSVFVKGSELSNSGDDSCVFTSDESDWKTKSNPSVGARDEVGEASHLFYDRDVSID